MHDDLAAWFAYDRWANARVLEACRRLTSEQYVAEPVPGWSSVRSTLNHIALATEKNFRTVIGLEPGDAGAHPMPTQADLVTLDAAAVLLADTHRRIEELLPKLTPEQLATLVTVHVPGWKPFTLPRWAVLRHIVSHAGYHRGQIASKLKRFGIEQPNTDFFFWASEQFGQEA